MDFLPLSSVFDGAGAILWGGVITFLVLTLQAITFIPLPEGGRARATTITILCAIVMAGAVIDRGEPISPNYVVIIVLSFANLVAASAGVRAAAKVAVPALTTAANTPKEG